MDLSAAEEQEVEARANAIYNAYLRRQAAAVLRRTQAIRHMQIDLAAQIEQLTSTDHDGDQSAAEAETLDTARQVRDMNPRLRGIRTDVPDDSGVDEATATARQFHRQFGFGRHGK